MCLAQFQCLKCKKFYGVRSLFCIRFEHHDTKTVYQDCIDCKRSTISERGLIKMSEPLTKDKLKCGCSSQLIETRDIKNCPTRYLSEKDLKSALEEFEKLLIHHKPDNPKYMMRLLKKAFPAIYEKGDD